MRSSEPVARGRRRQQAVARRSSSSCASTAPSTCPSRRTPDTAEASTRSRASLPAAVEWVLVSNPDIRWHAGAIDSLLATARSDRPDRLGRADGAQRRRLGLPVRARGALAAHRDRPRAVRQRLARQPVDPRLPRRACRPRRRPRRRLALRLVRAGPAQRVRRARRVRRRLLHVLRGRRPRLPPRQGRLPQRLRARAPWSPTPARTRRSVESERMVRAHHESARRFLQRKYPGPAALAGSGRAGARPRGSIGDAPPHASARPDPALR